MVVGAELDILISIAAQLTKKTPANKIRVPEAGDNGAGFSFNLFSL